MSLSQAAASVKPSVCRAETKVPDTTPELIDAYATNDEQVLLAKLRYNRLIDTFTGLTCYSLQSGLITIIPSVGQVEVDEIYIGVDQQDKHFVLPVQAKGRRGKIGLVQIARNHAVCKARFPKLVCRCIGAQLLADDRVALFAFQLVDGSVKVVDEKHYHLMRSFGLSARELLAHQRHKACSVMARR